MKSLISLLTILCSGMLLCAMAPNMATDQLETPNRWEKLGQKVVNYSLDRDEIAVTAREGRFTALKFKVRNSAVNIHRCVVHFRNGDTQTLQIRNRIPAGGETRVLNLEGNRRIISKVVFWYDTNNSANNRARLSLWGRH